MRGGAAPSHPDEPSGGGQGWGWGRGERQAGAGLQEGRLETQAASAGAGLRWAGQSDRLLCFNGAEKRLEVLNGGLMFSLEAPWLLMERICWDKRHGREAWVVGEAGVLGLDQA